jgi:raffinose/stachyose/melibiose transport system permease protein
MKRVFSNPWSIMLFLAPAFFFYLSFSFIPIFQSFWISLFHIDLGSKTWVGLSNYSRMLQDGLFVQALVHIFILLAIVVIISLPSAFVIAWILSQKIRGSGFVRSIMYIPNLLSTVATGTVWIYLFHNQYGVVNRILSLFGIQETDSLLANPKTVMYAIGIVMAWHSVGFYIILFMVAIQNIPQDILDSAKVDGLNQWQRVRYITLPLIVPTIEITLVLVSTGVFKSFDYIFVLTAGGPNHASEVISYYMYIVGFHYNDLGYAASIGLVLFFLCLVITRLISLLFGSKEAVQY